MQNSVGLQGAQYNKLHHYLIWKLHKKSDRLKQSFCQAFFQKTNKNGTNVKQVEVTNKMLYLNMWAKGARKPRDTEKPVRV